jgi:hypothetical protein
LEIHGMEIRTAGGERTPADRIGNVAPHEPDASLPVGSYVDSE